LRNKFEGMIENDNMISISRYWSIILMDIEKEEYIEIE
jgi:hypothetical protein